MASETEFEPMDQDGDDGGDTLQVEVTNDMFKNNNENELELDLEADDLEITEFSKTDDRQKKEELASRTSNTKNATLNRSGGRTARAVSPIENITISVMEPDDNGGDSAKEDGEISETQSQSDGSIDDNTQYFSRSSSLRSSKRRNDIRRERSPVARRYPNPYLEFDDEKIQSRALRFGLANSTTGSGTEKNVQLSDEDLINFYISCGVIQDDGGKLTLDKVAPHYRLDSIVVRGTNHMNTNEIFKYLYDLGQKPIAMEWVNDAMCVVIYKDQYDAATALLKTSKPILMDPRMIERKRSIVQSVENPEKDENNEEKSENMNEDFDYDKVDVIPQSSITVPMPPGYVWRFGIPCEKAKGILIRYATKNDKKQERAERFSEFYQKYGNPNKAVGNRENTGGGENIRRRKKVRSEHLAFEPDRREKEEASYRESQMKLANPNDKNGWGQLSAMWDDEEAFQRSARDRLTTARHPSKEPEDEDGSPSGISPMKRQDSIKSTEVITVPFAKTVDARDLLKTRQKRKRGTNSSDEEGESVSDIEDNVNIDNDARFALNDWKDGTHRRKRNSSRKGGGNEDDDDDGDNIAWRERLSAPRMRMHADEEEERQKRRAHRRLGHKRSNENSGSFAQTNWEFSRESSRNSSFRTKANSKARRPIAERLGAKRSGGNDYQDNMREGGGGGGGVSVSVEESLNNQQGGFDLRQKLINMRRSGNGDEGESDGYDDDEDLHNLIFRDID